MEGERGGKRRGRPPLTQLPGSALQRLVYTTPCPSIPAHAPVAISMSGCTHMCIIHIEYTIRSSETPGSSYVAEDPRDISPYSVAVA